MTVLRGLVLLLFGLSGHAAAAEPVVHWLLSDLAPFRILSGPAQGQGSSDLMEKMLMAQLPQYQHRSRFVSFERREVLHGDASALYCSFGILNNAKRQRQMLMSVPAGVVMPVALATVADSKLDQELQQLQVPVVDLQQLVSRQRYLGLLESGRGYPQLIDQARTIPGGLLGDHSAIDQNPVDLLLGGRVDYLLEYPHRVNFLLNSSKQPTATLHFYLLAGDDSYQTTYVACSKHPAAPKLINDINQQLVKLWANPEYQQKMLSWHDDKSKLALQQLMQQVQSQLVNQQTKPSSTAPKTAHL
ncbi:hypothetical protein A5320_17090 [Rheinheimera sp. SA_1]|uniref:hypothetical protein n=1 Tax=Rheinheimera sp. SA_1 TaxID=1827365 RepID=UPI0007FFC918|nr:hypothetical protein [Rheinheimera sp. SA_1]OBP13640.1 hypothetical protein A5320_17090 [Rheinheimera sp. SA_1]